MRRRFWLGVGLAAGIAVVGSSTSGLASDVRPVSAGWLRIEGGKIRGPYLQRSEAGVRLALGSVVSLQLHYERTAQAPLMHVDHDDGIMARLRFGF